MPRIKPPVKTPSIDMTPMVDMFALLLTFFMLTASFRPTEAVQIETPASVSEKQMQDKDIMTIFVAKDGKVFFNIDNGKDTTTLYRADILKQMGERYNISFTDEEVEIFSRLAGFGMPLKDLKAWIHAKDSDERDRLQTGIPIDSTDNQLAYWVRFARLTNPWAEVAIKGDAETNYTDVKKIMDLLQENKVNKFNLITNLEKVEATPEDIPQGSLNE